jgi:hypothetical protein
VKAAAGDLKSMSVSLAVSRDAVAAAANEHLRTLAALAVAAEGHNALLATSRARPAELGLAVRDDLVDVDDGQEHAEGALERGLRAGGVDWIPVDAAGLTAHAARQVFASYGPLHPLAEVGKYTWRPFEVEQRADGLKVPALTSAVPAAPVPVPIPADRLTVRDMLPEPQLAETGGYYPPKPLRPVPRGMVRA